MSTSWDELNKIDFLLQVKPSAVVFDLSLRTLQTGAVSEGTPTQRINFLWTCPAATLCCGAPLVIKNRLLPLWSQGPRSILIYFVLHAIPQGLSGWKSTPITATAEGKRAPFLVLLTLEEHTKKRSCIAQCEEEAVARHHQAADTQEVIVRIKPISFFLMSPIVLQKPEICIWRSTNHSGCFREN